MQKKNECWQWKKMKKKWMKEPRKRMTRIKNKKQKNQHNERMRKWMNANFLLK